MLNVKNFSALLSITLLTATLCVRSVYAADVNAGADSFDANCADCHSIAKPAKNKKGPSLLGVGGRASASIAGYEYSQAMSAANLLWTRENLDSYITNPKAFVPNDKMKFKGLSNAVERENLIEFLLMQK